MSDFFSADNLIVNLNEIKKINYFGIDKNEFFEQFLKNQKIVSIVTVLEIYIAKMLNDFMEYNKKNSNPAKIIPKDLRKTIYEKSLEELNEIAGGTAPNGYKQKIHNLNIIHDDKFNLSNLTIDLNFTFNKHGTNEIIKCLRKIGIDNIFFAIPEYRKHESLSITNFFVDIKGNIDKLVNHRNSVVHEGKDISISDTELNDFFEIVEYFILKTSEEISNLVAMNTK